MLRRILGRRPIRPPQGWLTLPLPRDPDAELQINAALEDWSRRFDFIVLCHVSVDMTRGLTGGAALLHSRIVDTAERKGRGVLSALVCTPDTWEYLCYARTLRDAHELRHELLGLYPGGNLALRIERDEFWLVYREMLPV